MISSTPMKSIPAGNPFLHDSYNMGFEVGTNVTVMFENHSNEICNYLIIVNTETGERMRIFFNEEGSKENICETIFMKLFS